jgi:putative transposase
VSASRSFTQVRRDERNLDDQALITWIVEIHTTHPAYGAERITREIKCRGLEIGRRRAARLMRANGIAGPPARNRKSLTKPDAAAARVPDLLRREFTALMPGLRLIGDISCFRPATAGSTWRRCRICAAKS